MHKTIALPASAFCLNPEFETYAACKYSFSCFLRRWRSEKDRKIADVASHLGVATSTWGNWETMLSMPSVQTLHDMPKVVGVPARCLICTGVERCWCEISDKLIVRSSVRFPLIIGNGWPQGQSILQPEK